MKNNSSTAYQTWLSNRSVDYNKNAPGGKSQKAPKRNLIICACEELQGPNGVIPEDFTIALWIGASAVSDPASPG